jgi:hypothetical protein
LASLAFGLVIARAFFRPLVIAAIKAFLGDLTPPDHDAPDVENVDW